jgi:hypothetical protein
MNHFLKAGTEQVDSSQFAVLRILLYLLSHRQGPMNRMEANWFLFQARKHHLSKEQRKILHSDLTDRLDIELIFEEVHDQDLDPLMRLLDLASKVDGKVTDEEKKFLLDIQKMVKFRRLNPKDVIQNFISAHEHRQNAWSRVQAIGELLSKRMPLFRRLW